MILQKQLSDKNNVKSLLRLFSNYAYNNFIESSAPSAHFTISGRKRFYKYVTITESKPGHFGILLDGKFLKTPAKKHLELPSLELALAIAAEWDAQRGSRGIQPVSMPFMSLSCTAIDQVAVDPAYTRQVCLSYLASDTSLYFVSSDEEALLNRQRHHFLPILTWIQQKYNIELSVSYNSSTMRLKHNEKTVEKISELINALDPFALTALQSATMELKSIILGLACLGRKISYEEALLVGRLEEEYQMEQWGLVEGGHDMDRLNNQVRLSSVICFLNMLYDNHNHSLI